MRAPLPHWVALDAGPPFRCPYLDDRLARFALGATLPSSTDFDRLMALGYRRSGRLFYVPACPGGCRACTPIRVPVAGFTPTRSQRRIAARHGRRFEVSMGEPRFSEEGFAVFCRHHARLAPEEASPERDGYRWSCVETCADTRMLEFRIGGRLAAFSILDVGEHTASSVYCAWDPDYAAFGPGTFSVLWEIDWCRRRRIAHYHLGYWIAGNRRLDYKARFGPCEVFDWQRGAWQSYRPAQGAAASITSDGGTPSSSSARARPSCR